ncbi:prepilin-type N-terminal cleavage/methylation domain-containing protein [Candidatus Electrothrix aarhusensis]|jgi:prepilin-type N-terminal cleavage/methylation domain-containing protein|uniref:Prepilin-type N-terminal cleavage/methylation domain-containing protein n=1 Tax=Candidatus Electrothrix aarhusensis TaxID=1859131 RepID=A0A3S3QEB8_9BACT|nr:prepilin-type N-terminal cleavage/methylation domain-containing protein [Candidatus Electrothrix aarhusensis]
MMCFKKTDGFSAPELLMVVAIIGIMAAVAIPSFISGIPRRQLKSAARDLYGAVQQARILAVKNSQNYTLIFEADFYYLDEDNDKSYDASAEVFTDKDDDGTYDIGEPFIDSDGSGSYSFAEKRTDLSKYNDVKFGSSTAPMSQDKLDRIGAHSSSKALFITFTPAGTAEFSPDPVSGDNTVYLQNINNPSESVAVSVQLSGASKISWYTGNGTWE